MGDLICSLSPTLMVIVPQDNFLDKTYIFPMFLSLSWFISLTTIAQTIAQTKIKTNHTQYQNESYQIEPHYILYRDELNNRNINFALPIITILTFSYSYSCPALKDILIWLFEGYLDYVSHA